jgi:hypothetical protein
MEIDVAEKYRDFLTAVNLKIDNPPVQELSEFNTILLRHGYSVFNEEYSNILLRHNNEISADHAVLKELRR